MTGRWPVTLFAVAGAMLAGIAAQVGSSPLASLAWALAAGVGLSLMLHGFGLRIVGVALTCLAVVGIGWAAQVGQWVALVGFVLVTVAGLGFTVRGPNWRHQRVRRQSAPGLWQAMDPGGDPTDEQGQAGTVD